MVRGTTSVQGVSLRELFPEAEIFGADEIRVSRLSVDSRRCRPGDLFVAMPGTQCDGHSFAMQAVAAGASAILTDRPIPGCPVPACFVTDVREACGWLCQALAGNPTRQLKTVGITGTNGKTTTSYLVASILDTAGYRAGVLGTLGYYDGVDVAKASWTTPPAHVLAPALARMVANGCSHGVMEVSSHALAQRRTAGMQFDVACLTNVGHDHLDFHRTRRNYLKAKQKLFEQLAPEGFAIVNADDEVCLDFLDKLDGPVLTVGIDAAAEITASPLEQLSSEQTFLLAIGDESAPVRTTLIGRHNISNCLVAAAVGFAYGIDLPTIVRGLEAVERMPGRLERLECGQPFGVFVDYAHTPDALTRVLSTLREVTPGRLICVFGAGGDRDRSKRPWMGRAVHDLADLAVVTSDNPRSEEPGSIIADILPGFRNRHRAQVILDRADAIRHALDEARRGDCVLIAGKGHEAYQIVGAETLPFDDREIACACLYGADEAPLRYRASA
jgi:UDP-N-acetylmuramoyl-L-alanyl-D-glutamate--2,6-diaminopimelate ligase